MMIIQRLSIRDISEGTFHRKFALLSGHIKSQGLGEDTELHKAYNELKESIMNIDIHNLRSMEDIDINSAKVEKIIDKLITETKSTTFKELIDKLSMELSIEEKEIIKKIINSKESSIVIFSLNDEYSAKSFFKGIKKLLKSLKVLGLDKNTNLYNLYKELKQEIKKKDKLGSTLDDSMMCKLCEITDIVNKLMSMTKIGNLSDLINYLEFQEYEIVDAIKIRYFLINGDELFNLEYSDNVTLNIFKAHDSFIESLCSDFKENLKTSLSSLCEREDIVDGKRITNVRIDVNFSLTDVTKVV